MPPSDSDGEASDEYLLACHAAVQANKLEFALDVKSYGTFGNGDGGGHSTFDKCTVSAIVRPDGDMLPVQDEIATLRMTAIAESRVNPETFCGDLEGTIQEAKQLIAGLLNTNGTFKWRTWGRGSPYGGTGVWHSEFGRDLLVYIEEIKIKHTFRGMGIGNKLFDQALDWASKKAQELGLDNDSGSYLVVAPGPLIGDVDREFGAANMFTGGYDLRKAEVISVREKLRDKAIAFWRKQGFRRVGLSRFWAYATNPNHPSRQLTAEEDAKRDNIMIPQLDDFDDIDVMDLLA